MNIEDINYYCARCGAVKTLHLSNQHPLSIEDIKCDKCECTVLYKEKLAIQEAIEAR